MTNLYITVHVLVAIFWSLPRVTLGLYSSRFTLLLFFLSDMPALRLLAKGVAPIDCDPQAAPDVQVQDSVDIGSTILSPERCP
jgi:hypothetical protein